jgi:hypothetical protein
MGVRGVPPPRLRRGVTVTSGGPKLMPNCTTDDCPPLDQRLCPEQIARCSTGTGTGTGRLRPGKIPRIPVDPDLQDLVEGRGIRRRDVSAGGEDRGDEPISDLARPGEMQVLDMLRLRPGDAEERPIAGAVEVHHMNLERQRAGEEKAREDAKRSGESIAPMLASHEMAPRCRRHVMVHLPKRLSRAAGASAAGSDLPDQSGVLAHLITELLVHPHDHGIGRLDAGERLLEATPHLGRAADPPPRRWSVRPSQLMPVCRFETSTNRAATSAAPGPGLTPEAIARG